MTLLGLRVNNAICAHQMDKKYNGFIQPSTKDLPSPAYLYRH